MKFFLNRILSSLLVLLFLVISLQTYSQLGESSAFLITQKGDTLFGEFEPSGITESPPKIGFKQAADNKYTYYGPAQIKGFSLNEQEKYYTRIVDINVSPIAVEKIRTDTKDPVFRTDTVFLQLLVAGRANLHGLQDKGRWHFFIQKEEVPLEELILTRYISYQGREQISTYNEQYKGRLRNLFSDSEEIFALVPLIDKTRYKERELIKLVIAYNQSVDDLSYEASKLKRTKLGWGVLAGISANTLDLTGAVSLVPVNFSELSFPLRPGIQIGVFLKQELLNSGINLLHELQFRTFEVTGSSERLSPTNFFFEEEVVTDFTYLELNNILRKKLGKIVSGRFVFLEGGVGVSLFMKDENSWSQKTSNDNFSTESQGIIAERPRTVELGLLAGGGYEMKKISVGLRYRFGTGFLSRSNGRSFSHTLALLVAYDLK